MLIVLPMLSALRKSTLIARISTRSTRRLTNKKQAIQVKSGRLENFKPSYLFFVLLLHQITFT